jgi:hypothetical protein
MRTCSLLCRLQDSSRFGSVTSLGHGYIIAQCTRGWRVARELGIVNADPDLKSICLWLWDKIE